MSDEQWLQLLLVGAPVLSLIGAWMSLKTYSKLTRKQPDPQAEAEAEAKNTADSGQPKT
ncbi:MAG: hypothetical protein LBL69_05025 [Zoogloeaceae bacterium]|jgi:hypothetical protein|nr:hypothetical protein [Zoogloeaceae bacterium]